MSDDTGGPAFPRLYPRSDEDGRSGMTLRDYFAAKAMQGLMGRTWGNKVTGEMPDDLFQIWASSAYAVADAMLAERDT